MTMELANDFLKICNKGLWQTETDIYETLGWLSSVAGWGVDWAEFLQKKKDKQQFTPKVQIV